MTTGLWGYLLIGGIFGIIIGEIITIRSLKKKLKGECGKCKFCSDCMGYNKMNKSAEDQTCQFFQNKGETDGNEQE